MKRSKGSRFCCLPARRNCCANASSWSIQVPQPSEKPIAAWRSLVTLSGCITVATYRVPPASSAIVMMAVNGNQGVAGRQSASSSEVKTMRVCGTISRNEPGLSLVPPSGPCMKVWKAPPTRRLKVRTSVAQGFGHHHSFSSAGSVQARQSRARGARTRREMTRSRGSAPALSGSATAQFLLVKFLGKGRQAVSACFPSAALFGHPPRCRRERLRPQLAGAYPPDLVRADHAAAFEHSQVFHERRQRHLERCGQCRHRSRPAAKRAHDLAARGVGERVEHVRETTLLLSHPAQYMRVEPGLARAALPARHSPARSLRARHHKRPAPHQPEACSRISLRRRRRTLNSTARPITGTAIIVTRPSLMPAPLASGLNR